MKSLILEDYIAIFLVAFAAMVQIWNIPHVGYSGEIGAFLGFSLLVQAGVVFLLLSRRSYLLPVLAPAAVAWWVLLCLSVFQPLHRNEAVVALAALTAAILGVFLVVHLYRTVVFLGSLLVDALMVTGVVAALLGLYQYVHYSLFGQAGGVLIPSILTASRNWRVTGVYNQPNMFALFLMVCLLAFFYRYIHAPAPVSHPMILRLRMVPVFLIGLVFFLTQSRGGLVAMAVTIGFLVTLFVRKKYAQGSREEKREFLLLLLTLMMSGVFYWLWSGLGADGQASPPRGGNSAARLVFWASCLLMFKTHPWAGVGFGNFKFALPSFQLPAHDALKVVEYEAMTYTNWAHNELLQLLAEGGLFPFALLLLFFVLYVRALWRRFHVDNGGERSFFLYSHLFLLPFVCQSMFSWPLRFPQLMVLFWIFLGVLLAQYPVKELRLSDGARRAVALLLFCGVLVVGRFAWQEHRMLAIPRSIDSAEAYDENMPALHAVVGDPYSEVTALNVILPRFISFALKNKDASMARELLPYAKRIADIQGASWQWYNLSLLYYAAGEQLLAQRSVQMAIDRQPTNEKAWGVKHYLNVIDVARKTGRSVESLLPDEGAVNSISSEILRAKTEDVERSQNL